MKFDGNEWQLLGKSAFSDIGQYTHNSMDISIRVDSKGSPYVVYQDMSMDNSFVFTGGTTVQRFNGTSWEKVGKQGFANWCAM